LYFIISIIHNFS